MTDVGFSVEILTRLELIIGDDDYGGNNDGGADLVLGYWGEASEFVCLGAFVDWVCVMI